MDYELHYGTGGTGGPYLTLDDAIAAAERRLMGSDSEITIDIAHGTTGGRVAARVRRYRPAPVDREGRPVHLGVTRWES